MKKNQFLTKKPLLLFVLLFTTVAFALFAKDKSSISSSIKDVVDLPKFNKIHISSAFKVKLSQGATQKVALISDDNLQKNKVSLRVIDGTLIVKYKENTRISDEEITIDITVPDIEAIKLSGAVELNASYFNNIDKLSFDISGASTIDFGGSIQNLIISESGASTINLEGKVGVANIKLSGASTLDAEKCTFSKVNVDASGASQADFHKVSNFHSHESGASEISND